MVCICMLMAYLLFGSGLSIGLWISARGWLSGGSKIEGLGLGLQGLYSATNYVVTIMNKQQNKQKL